MKSKYTRPLAALGVVAALALPAAAVGKGPDGHGKGAEHAGKGAKAPKGPKTRALNVKGTVAAVGDGTVDVVVKSANRHGRALKGETLTVDVSRARIVVRDVNDDGERNLGDVAVGDRVLVQARIAKGAAPDPAQPVVAKKLVDKGAPKPPPAPEEPGDDEGDDDGEDGGETPPAP
jgi:acylphosphatase